MIRDYCNSDFLRCREIVNEVWKFSDTFHPSQLADLFLDVYTGGSLAESNHAIVVEAFGRVEGFLFGKSGNTKVIQTRFSGIPGHFMLFLRLLSVKGVSWKSKKNYMAMFREHEINRYRAEKHRENEVQLFAVSPAAQGNGYGKALMQEYIRECKARHVRRITLDTDKDCNYLFYERFGFRRIAEFYSPIQKLYTGTYGMSFVYELNIEANM